MHELLKETELTSRCLTKGPDVVRPAGGRDSEEYNIILKRGSRWEEAFAITFYDMLCCLKSLSVRAECI